MRRAVKLSAVGIVAVVLSGFIAGQSPEGRGGAATRAAESSVEGRYVIYQDGSSLPMLLDTKTGRSWYRALPKDQRVVWVPIVMANPDSELNYLPPEEAK